jgi:hypothetical protein
LLCVFGAVWPCMPQGSFGILCACFAGISREERYRLLHVVVVGGGPTGVEFAGEICDFINGDLHSIDPDRARDIRCSRRRDRQKDRQAAGQVNGRSDRQTDRRTGRQAGRQLVGQNGRRDRHAVKRHRNIRCAVVVEGTCYVGSMLCQCYVGIDFSCKCLPPWPVHTPQLLRSRLSPPQQPSWCILAALENQVVHIPNQGCLGREQKPGCARATRTGTRVQNTPKPWLRNTHMCQ